MSMRVSSLKKSLRLLDAQTRKILPLIFVSFVVVSALDAVGIALFFPLMLSLTSDPSVAGGFDVKSYIPQALLSSSIGGTMLIAIFLATVFVVKNAVSYILLRWQYTTLFRAEALLSERLYELYLKCRWVDIFQRNSSELIRNSSVSCSQYFLSFVIPFMTVVVECLVFLMIVTLVVFISPVISLVSFLALSLFSVIYYLFFRGRLQVIGQRFQRANFDVLNELKQGLGIGREIRVLGRQDELVRRLHGARLMYADAQTSRNALVQLPRYYLEVVLVLLVLLVILVMTGAMPRTEIMPVLAVFGVASLRMMNSANKILAGVQQMRIGAPAVDEVYEEFQRLKALAMPVGAAHGSGPSAGDGLSLRDVQLVYPNGNHVLKGIDLHVRWGECIGIVGTSGSGKSTLLDVMIGLLPPTGGSIRVDGHELSSSWLARIGYVPQSVYLSDDTLKGNVAFGIAPDEIDEERVWQALQLAQLEGFARALPLGLDTIVGEQGSAISGGQRQRIGIARALYRDPDILFLDEATSALDDETERLIVESIESLVGKKTVVIIAHRLSTLAPCNRVVEMQAGMLKEVSNG